MFGRIAPAWARKLWPWSHSDWMFVLPKYVKIISPCCNRYSMWLETCFLIVRQVFRALSEASNNRISIQAFLVGACETWFKPWTCKGFHDSCSWWEDVIDPTSMLEHANVTSDGQGFHACWWIVFILPWVPATYETCFTAKEFIVLTIWQRTLGPLNTWTFD